MCVMETRREKNINCKCVSRGHIYFVYAHGKSGTIKYLLLHGIPDRSEHQGQWAVSNVVKGET